MKNKKNISREFNELYGFNEQKLLSMDEDTLKMLLSYFYNFPINNYNTIKVIKLIEKVLKKKNDLFY